jgi:hypothetical protein
MMGDGKTMRQMLHIAIKAKERFPDSPSLSRACYKITNACISARYNLSRISQYIQAWDTQEASKLKE